MSVEAIGDVSDTLVNLLKSNIDDFSDETQDVIIASPTDIPQQPAKTEIALYLYSIIENPDLKNEERLRIDHKTSRRSPLSLDLYYMLTVYPVFSNDANEQHGHNLSAHRTMGRAMRVFYDNGILAGSMLRGTLLNSAQELRITLNPITVEDLTRIWSVFPEASYRTSVCYLVTPIRIDSVDVATAQRVVERQLTHSSMVQISETH
jgi:hypothetical protein